MKLGRVLGQVSAGQVSGQTGRSFFRALAVGIFAVTSLAGAWAQSSDYPKEPPYAQGPGAGQQSGAEQGAPYPGDQNSGNQYPEDRNAQGQNGPVMNAPNGPGPSDGSNGSGEEQRSQGSAPNVARLSLIYGDVSTQRGDSGDWSVSTVNAPVMQGDQVATGDKSRTEIQLDFADLLRLAARSQVKVADLSAKRIQVQVAQGYASYTMLKGGEAEVEIDSPNVAVHPLKNGRYRVQVNSDAETNVIVREGEAEITTPQGSTRVREGEMITIRGTDNPEYKVSAAPEKDDWDKWNRDRDSVIREADGPRRTNQYYTGTADLDGYGHWVYVPGYGNVWQPYQQSGTWAPYQTGRWVWEPYYGWTWVSYEPWGWAPYHYGRWFYYENSWCWWPGPVYGGYRPLWSPAFVTFIGFGPRVGFGFGFGSIGWFPVGPHDVFYPWYGRGFNRVNVVAFGSVGVVGRGGFIAPLAVRGRQPFFSNANLVLSNARVRGSVTSISTNEFGRGTGAFRRGVEEGELRQSHVMTANVPVVPTRESLNAGRFNGAGPAAAQTRSNERFFTQHQPPAARQESFHDQAARMQRVVGSEGAAQNSRSGEIRGNEARGNNEVRNNEGRSAAQVDRRDGSGNTGVNARTGNESRQGAATRSEGTNGSDNSRSGWSHFGPPGGRTNSEFGRVDSGASGSRSTETNRSSESTGNDRGARNESQPTHGGEAGGSKPPLELHHPIVTERQSDPRSSGTSAPSSRSSEGRSEPGRSQPRYSPPPRSEAPRASRGSESHSGGSSRSGGGSHESKSSGKH
jgi:FecR protein